MFKNDETKATGKLTVEIKDKHGNVKETREVRCNFILRCQRLINRGR